MSLAVVHLTSVSLGPEPFAAFLASLRAHDAGAGHELVVVYNGFADADAAAHMRELAADVPHEAVYLPRWQIDLAAYREAARAVGHDRVCLLNAGAEVLAGGWLAKLDAALAAPGVGAAAATGSYESHRTQLEAELHRPRPRTPRGLAGKVAMRLEHRRFAADFDPFPNPHVRTNGLLLDRATMLEVWPEHIGDKHAAHAFESGRRGLTRRLEERGLTAVVVGRDGRAYAAPEWPDSATFRAGEQANLLIADNRTRQYAHAPAAERAALAEAAWGTR